MLDAARVTTPHCDLATVKVRYQLPGMAALQNEMRSSAAIARARYDGAFGRMALCQQ